MRRIGHARRVSIRSHDGHTRIVIVPVGIK